MLPSKTWPNWVCVGVTIVPFAPLALVTTGQYSNCTSSAVIQHNWQQLSGGVYAELVITVVGNVNPRFNISDAVEVVPYSVTTESNSDEHEHAVQYISVCPCGGTVHKASHGVATVPVKLNLSAPLSLPTVHKEPFFQFESYRLLLVRGLEQNVELEIQSRDESAIHSLC